MALDIARSTDELGILLIEAPMGEGKTEAALAAAEALAARAGVGGLFVVLPTQATTDAMFARVLDWLDRMGANDQDIAGSITLSHGKARFNRLFQGLLPAGRIQDVGRDEQFHTTRHAVSAHAWLMGRKKAQLANFSIGTIDQLLFAGLKARHLMLRHLALAGKIVIIDEIHAYDAYMNSYLARVLTWLGAYRVPVVALSATLPADRRQELVSAYQAGRTRATDGATDGESDRCGGDIGYPMLTWTEGSRARSRVAAASGRRTTVHVHVVDDDPESLVNVLRETMAEGGAALVIRNTVPRVLETAEAVEQAFPGEVTVAHSRFIVADRLRNDAALLDSFGPPGRALRRPRRHVVVASQVVEQSLDVDFDLLITDLAPIDLVLQRMGRLHRHERGHRQSERPERVRTARAYIAGADFTQSPVALDAGAQRVYGAHALLRSAAVLLRRLGRTVGLPDDIAELVEAAYGPEQVGPPEWQEAMGAAEEKWRAATARREEKAEQFQIVAPAKPGRPIIGWLAADVGEADDGAQGQGQVRDGAPSLEAILVQTDAAGQWHTPNWLEDPTGNLPVPTDHAPPDRLAEVLASCALRLPLNFSNAESEQELWDATPAAWEGSPLIFRLPALVVDDDGWGVVNGRRIRYTPRRGLEVLKNDE